MRGEASARHAVGVPPHGVTRRRMAGWLGSASTVGAIAVQFNTTSSASQETTSMSTPVSTPGEASGTIGLGIVGLIVRDLQASLDFYRRLGLPIPPGTGGSNFRLRLPTGQVFFWDDYATTRSFDPDWQPSSGSRRIVLEFGFASPEALDATYAELTGAGYEGYLPPFDIGARYALVKDPDGNEIGLRYPAVS